MSHNRRIIIAGAYGIFGRLLAKELLKLSRLHVVLAGRDEARLRRINYKLSSKVKLRMLNLTDMQAVRCAVADAYAMVCTSEPLQILSSGGRHFS